MRQLPTLRQLLLLLAFACVLPMAGLALGLVAYQYDRERKQIEADTISTARALMGSVDDRFERIESALTGLVASPALAAADYERLYVEATAVQRSEQITNVLLLDATGRQLMNTRLPFGAPLPLNAWPQMLDASRTAKPSVIDLFRSPVTNHWQVGVGVPVNVGAASLQSLNANLEPAWLREVLVRQKMPSTWIAAIVDRSGAIVARTHDHDRFVGTRARPALIARIAEVPEDAVESTTVDGVPVITAFSRSARSGWSVAIGIPRTDLTAPVIRTSALLLLGTAGVLGLTLWMALLLARRLGASVESLGGAVRATGHRARLKLPDPVFQEARQLGYALAYASAAVEDAVAARSRSEARLEAILDTATDAIVTADADGRIVLFNRAAEEMFGCQRSAVLGEPVDTLVPASVPDRHMRVLEGAAEGSARSMADGCVIECLRADGSAFFAEASISLADDDEGPLYTMILREVRQEGASP
jgi:PAS domain S-box-containing protein